MAMPVYATNWSHRVPPTANGGGIYSVVSGSVMSIDTTILSPQSLKCVASASAGYVGYAQVAGAGVLVGRVYAYFPTSLPSTVMQFIIGNATGAFGIIRYNNATGKFDIGNSDLWTPGNVTAQTNTLYRFDFRIDVSGTTYTGDWKIDGVDQPQWSLSGQTGTSWVNLRLGSATSATGTVLFQHLVLSTTSADYPLPAGTGGTHWILPSGDGTHNPGTNVMEDNTGADIGATTAYDKLNTFPPPATPYVRQAANGTGNYAEVLFGNLPGSPGDILCAVGILGYTSATTTANRGATIMSKDNFASYTTIWGNPTTTSDYSDGSTSNVYWKSAVIDGAIDATTVDALKARIGYSGDTSPIPYWMVLGVEVAYTVSSSTDIDLDLVTYTRTVNDISVLENIVIDLDLVTYSRTVNDLIVTENILIDLDLVTYTRTVNDLTVTENVVIPLDLVSITNTVNDITVLEAEIVPLDLVSYSVVVNDLVLTENVVVDLDLVTYTGSINDVTVLEHEIVPLDLVTYTSSLNDITTYEDTFTDLSLVSYSFAVNDLGVLENEVSSLDLVIYETTVYEADLLEDGEDALDLVNYSITVYDLTVIESEITELDLVLYSSDVYDLTVTGNEITELDLVSYSLVFPDILVIDDNPIIRTPFERIFVIAKQLRLLVVTNQPRRFFVVGERRSITVESQDRTVSVPKEDRAISVRKDE